MVSSVHGKCALMIVGVMSTGGLAAVVVKRWVLSPSQRNRSKLKPKEETWGEVTNEQVNLICGCMRAA